MALFGMANVPFIYISVNVWRTLHPQTSVVPTLPVSMGGPLWFCFAALLLFFLSALSLRARLERERARVEALYLAEDEA
jgi:heme exporter protein C